MKKLPPTITPKQARQRGYRSMTIQYILPRERWMIDGVIADLRAVDAEWCLVRAEKWEGVEVWRR